MSEPALMTMKAAAPAQPSAWTLSSRGKVGIVCVILTESSFFAIFVGAYLFYLGKSLAGPYPDDVLRVPVVATICLLSSSLTIVLAVRALRANAVGLFGLWWLVTLALGAEFLTATGFEWRHLIYDEGLTIHTNLFGTTYYSLVGLHALHVTVGLLAMLVVMILTIGGHVDRRHAERAEVLSWYWHFVDAVWVIVFLTVYVVGR
jgi:cytochrome c oxidase subunit 3/cytochrome o ubiquinol oxidase subunit 3